MGDASMNYNISVSDFYEIIAKGTGTRIWGCRGE